MDEGVEIGYGCCYFLYGKEFGYFKLRFVYGEEEEFYEEEGYGNWNFRCDYDDEVLEELWY